MGLFQHKWAPWNEGCVSPLPTKVVTGIQSWAASQQGGQKKKKKSKPSEGMKEKEKREDYVGPQTTSCNLNILNLK